VGERICAELARDYEQACRERDEARAEVERRREQMDTEREGFDAFADLQRVKLAAARAEAARLRRLALVPMKPGEVPTEPGVYLMRVPRAIAVEVVQVGPTKDGDLWLTPATYWSEPVANHRAAWLARIPVEALGEVADG
jgi:hypothetical protein